ncbi:MAG: hypothetical protein AD742_06815 [Methylibium sp. NZG]|nr:MAG: hypothetical protein AD742_06815 [Methylibium sp. NZG]
MVCAAVLVFAHVLFPAWREAVPVPPSAWVVLLVAMLPWVQLAAGMPGFRGDAALASLYLLGFGLTQIVGHRAACVWGLERVLELVSWVFLTGAILSVALATYQWLQLDFLGAMVGDVTRGSRVFANLNQPNQLATLLILGLICAACLFDASSFGATVALCLVGVLAFGLAMTQSRGVVLQALVAGALLLFKSATFGRALTRRHVLIASAVVLLMPLLWNEINSMLALSEARDPEQAALAGSRRVIFWSAMADAVSQRPWAGFGWAQTTVAQFAVAVDHPPLHEVFSHSHNLWVDLVLWNGLPVGLCLCAASVLWLWASVRAVQGSTATLMLVFVVAVVVHAMLEYPLYYAYFLAPVGLVMGALHSATNAPGKARLLPAWTVFALATVALTLMTAIAVDYFRLERDIERLRFERARIGTDRPVHQLSQPLLLTQLGAFTHFARTPERHGMDDGELQAMAEVVARYPAPENIVRYAAALAVNDRPQLATNALRRVHRINSAADADRMRQLWRALGEREPAVARVAWPEG